MSSIHPSDLPEPLLQLLARPPPILRRKQLSDGSRQITEPSSPDQALQEVVVDLVPSLPQQHCYINQVPPEDAARLLRENLSSPP